MTHQAPRSWDDVRILQDLADQGDEEAEFWVENPVCWAFPWEHGLNLESAAWQRIA